MSTELSASVSRARPAPAPLIQVAGGGEASRLPTPLSGLVGREREIATLATLLRDPAVRLVTLTGPGGVGKTRLALRLAGDLAAEEYFTDGVAFVDLAPVRDPDLVAMTIAQALALRPGAYQAAVPALTSFLRSKDLLLVIDNFEHVTEAAPHLTAILQACPHLTMFVTSRSPLQVSGERAVPVPPLSSLPTPHSDAVRLFVERAQAVRADFALSAANLEAVAEICRRLDGLPLAIELAAARSALFTPPALLARLNHRLPQLTAGRRDRPARHRTMGDAIAWSYELLTPPEQLVFRRLAVFVGGCTLEAAEAVCGAAAMDIPTAPAVVAAIESLVHQSLLGVVDPALEGPDAGSSRLVMLETVREFAIERLTESDEAVAIHRAHAAYCLGFVERYEAPDLLPNADQVLAMLETEHANLRAALTWLETDGAAATFLRLAADLGRFWASRGHYQEGQSWLERALARNRGEATQDRARAIVNLGMIELYQGLTQSAETRLAEGLAACRAQDDSFLTTMALLGLAASAILRGDLARAAALLEDLLDVARSVSDERLAEIQAGTALTNLAVVARSQGEHARAVELLEDARQRMRSAGATRGTIMVLGDLGDLARDLGDHARALALYGEALALVSRNPRSREITDVVESVGIVAVAVGPTNRAVELLGAAEAMREWIGLRVRVAENQLALDQAIAAARAALGAAAFAADWSDGRSMQPGQAVAAALDLTSALPLSLPRGPLSPRELDVLRLLVAGLPDRSIAAELFLSARTVENHVARIFAKLGVRTRTAAVRAAIAAGYVEVGPPWTPDPTREPRPGAAGSTSLAIQLADDATDWAERSRLLGRGLVDETGGRCRHGRAIHRQATIWAVSSSSPSARPHLTTVPLAPVRGRGEPSHLPTPFSSLVGREREIASVATLLGDPAVRLVTLIGPGGVGKTRLALRLAADLAGTGRFAGGAVFVELAAVRDPDHVAPTIAHALGVRGVGQEPVETALRAFLRERQLLLVLDNFEQVIAAGPRVSDLLRACPRLTAIVTSRSLLQLSGEQVFPVLPLSLPRREASGVRREDDDDSPHASPLTPHASDAVRLFVERARAVQPDFALTETNVPVVAEISTRLDGLPLAIELAAARSGLFPPAALLARLERRLPLLTDGARDLPDRHRTMHDTIAWSHDLLSLDEQVCFRRLSVFAGGFTLEAAESVGRGDFPATVLDGISSLVAKNLLQRQDDPDGTPRFSMLETIREFATERLTASGEADAVGDAHATWVLALTEDASPRISPSLPSPDAAIWLTRLTAEHANLRAALSWLNAAGRWHDLLRLATAAVHFWELRLLPRDGRAWLERALDPTRTGDAPLALRARAMRGLGLLTLNLGDYDAAEAVLNEAHAAWLSLDDAIGAAMTLRMLGAVAEYRGDDERAAARQAAALALFRASGDTIGISAALQDLALGAIRRGDPAEADRLAEEAVAAARAIGSPIRLVGALGTLGGVAAARGEPVRAGAALGESLRLAQEMDYDLGTLDALVGLAEVAATTGALESAGRLLGASVALAEARGLSQMPNDALFRRTRDSVRTRLGAPMFAAMLDAGRVLTIEDAVAEALARAAAVMDAPPIALTPREREVLPLLAAGKSDREIGTALFLSRRTVENHVARLTAKLGVRTRVAAVEAARAAGLLPLAE